MCIGVLFLHETVRSHSGVPLHTVCRPLPPPPHSGPDLPCAVRLAQVTSLQVLGYSVSLAGFLSYNLLKAAGAGTALQGGQQPGPLSGPKAA